MSAGRAGAAAAPPQGGIHLVDWGCEAVGTALLLLGGLSAVCLDFGRGMPVAGAVGSTSLRLLITGGLFAATGSLFALTPLGRRSGAHLNPAVTLAFFTAGQVHRDDLLGYVGAQCLGALAGAGLVRWVWGPVAVSVSDGRTQLAPGVGWAQAVGIEALMTAILVAVILVCVAHRRTARWTPAAVWVVVALLVWRGAPYTGTSLNPARSLGPAVVSLHPALLFVYWLGPPLGALAAVALVRAEGRHHPPLTAKLFHDPRYPSVLRSRLPTAGRPGAA